MTTPTGKRRSPVGVVLLPWLTLGLYGFYWNWQVTNEASRFDPHRDDPHEAFKTALWLLLGAAISAIFFFLVFPLIIAGIMLLISVVYGITAQWRLWKFVEAYERRIGEPPLSPGLLAVLSFVPLISLIGSLYVPYRVQKGLNRIWQAYDARRTGQASTPVPGSPPGTARGAETQGAIGETSPQFPDGRRIDPERQDTGQPNPERSAAASPDETSPGSEIDEEDGPVDPWAQGDPNSSSASELRDLPPADSRSPEGEPETPIPSGSEEPESTAEQDIQPEEPPAHYEPYTCRTCGEEIQIPPERPLRVSCPACSTTHVVRSGD